jgi:hypothetical protein
MLPPVIGHLKNIQHRRYLCCEEQFRPRCQRKDNTEIEINQYQNADVNCIQLRPNAELDDNDKSDYLLK